MSDRPSDGFTFDELCAELGRMKLNLDMWHDRAEDMRNRLSAAQADNAKLREERDMYRDLVGMMDHPDLNAQLQAENAKLRDLCAELYAEMLTYSKAPTYNASVWSIKLRELGVEVDRCLRP